MSEFLRAQYSEPQEQLQRALGIQGPLPDAVDPQVEPVVQLLDLQAPEYLWLRRTLQFNAGGQTAAGANNSLAKFGNPANSAVLAVLEFEIFNSTGAAGQFGWWQDTAGASTALPVTNLDYRQPFNAGTLAPFPVCQPSTANAVVVPNVRIQLGSNGSYRHPRRFMVAPGFTLVIAAITVALQWHVQFHWTERQLQPMEV